jgi:hypothetical protein
MTGERGGGGGPESIRPQGSLVLYKSFNTLWKVNSIPVNLGYTHKTSGFKTSGFKTSGFKTSGFKTSGLQNVWFQNVWFQNVQFLNLIYLLNKKYLYCHFYLLLAIMVIYDKKTSKVENKTQPSLCLQTWLQYNLRISTNHKYRPDVLKPDVLKPDVLWMYEYQIWGQQGGDREDGLV